MDNPDQEPTWLNDYDEFVEELMINFSLYDQVADAEVELKQLVMKDNHKATKFFINFYWISALLDYNNQAVRSHSSWIYWMCLGRLGYIQKSTSAMHTILSESLKAMSGKLHSKHVTALTSGWSCCLASSSLQPHSNSL